MMTPEVLQVRAVMGDPLASYLCSYWVGAYGCLPSMSTDTPAPDDEPSDEPEEPM